MITAGPDIDDEANWRRYRRGRPDRRYAIATRVLSRRELRHPRGEQGRQADARNRSGVQSSGVISAAARRPFGLDPSARRWRPRPNATPTVSAIWRLTRRATARARGGLFRRHRDEPGCRGWASNYERQWGAANDSIGAPSVRHSCVGCQSRLLSRDPDCRG
jgi:hypothetical protein